jgi:hypothetical protein
MYMQKSQIIWLDLPVFPGNFSPCFKFDRLPEILESRHNNFQAQQLQDKL